MPYFSLIIATINRLEHHQNLLKSLKAQSFQNFEIVIVDQNPNDNLKNFLTDHLKNFNLVYLHTKEDLGLSCARNYGLKYANGKVVAFPDDDCWYQPNSLQMVYDYFEKHTQVDCITGLVTDVDGSFSAGGFMLKRKQVNVSYRNVWWTSNSSAIFLKKDVLEQIGEFDPSIGLGAERYISGEETDLVLRVHKHGHFIQYLPELNIFHKKYQGIYDKAERQKGYGYGLGMGYVLRKNEYGFFQLVFYSGIHFGKGTLMLLMFKGRRALFHYAQAVGRIRGWFEYPRSVKKKPE